MLPMLKEVAVFLALTLQVSAQTPPQLGLDQALQLALTRHPSLQVAASEEQAAQARVHEAEAAFWPKLGAGAYVNTGNVPMIVPGASSAEPQFWSLLPGGGLSLNLSLMLPLYTGGRLQARLAQTRAEARAQVARTALALREVARETRRAYFDLLQAQAATETARLNLQQREEVQRLTRLRVELGAVALYVQRRMEAETASARQSLNTARAEQEGARARFLLSLGNALQQPFELTVPPPPAPLASSLQEDVQKALAERSDLLVARALAESADERLQQVLSAYSPQLGLYAMGEQMRQPALGARPFEGGYQVGVVLSWPLFDGERDARQEEAEAMREARRHEVTGVEQRVSAEVAEARARLEAALANEELARTEQTAAETELSISRRRYEVGRGIYLEVLDALTALVRARQNVTASLRERGRAEADYLYSVGRLP